MIRRVAGRAGLICLLIKAVACPVSMSGAIAQPLPSFELKPSIEGIQIAIPVVVEVSRSATGDVTTLRLQADLAGLSSSLDQVVNAIWRREGLEGQRVSHRGTSMVVEGNALRLKVHFHANPRALPSSNGSLVLLLRPEVLDAGVGLSGTVAEFNVSNDITRGAVRALRLDERLKRELGRGLTDALSRPDARLAIPAAARAFGARATAASFAPPPPGPRLLIDATMPNAAIAGLTQCLLRIAACPQ